MWIARNDRNNLFHRPVHQKIHCTNGIDHNNEKGNLFEERLILEKKNVYGFFFFGGSETEVVSDIHKDMKQEGRKHNH